MFDWRGYVDLADDLLILRPNDEAAQRSALSRAYYGVFGVARDYLLTKRGVAIAAFNVHYHVWATFAQAPRGVEQRIAQEGNRLKRRRDLADYEGNYARLATESSRWVARARRLVADIDGLP
jgi:uncharacterized protein (UPF0332 family)